MAEKENIKDKLENLKEGHRKSNKDIIESLFAILGYLKNNTDVDNPTSQTQMRKVEEISEYLGTKSTFHNKMVNMAIALDSADGVTLNERRDCRLMFDSIDALIKEYESDEYFDDDDDELTLAEKINSVRGIYYNHPFSKSEVTDLINAVKMSKAIDEDKKPELVERIKTELASSHYKEYTCPIYNTENTDSQGLRENLNTIHDSFGEDYKITTEKYKKEHKLPKNQTNFEIVEVRTSPYGIVNWALQYSDKVEVIEPENVVKSIKERVEELCKKYNVNV